MSVIISYRSEEGYGRMREAVRVWRGWNVDEETKGLWVVIGLRVIGWGYLGIGSDSFESVWERRGMHVMAFMLLLGGGEM